MLVEILSYLHNTTTLLFGVYISAAFLGVKMSRKNTLMLLLFTLVSGAFYVLTYVLFGEKLTEQLYPLIVHLPLVIFLTAFYEYKFSLSCLSVLTAYLCCQASNWLGLAALNITNSQAVYYSVRIIATVIVFVLLIRYVSAATAGLLKKPTKSILILGLMPFVYYVFDYVTGVYTALLYSGIESVVEFLGFMICIFYILFIFLYFREYEEKTEAEQKSRMMKLHQQQVQKEIYTMRRSEHTVSILRHDMRHFLLTISAFIENGNDKKALDYINDVIKITDSTVNRRYCPNNTLNMILASYEEIMTENHIDFRCNINIPKTLPFSDVDITSILSNALENAVHAVLGLPQEERIIELSITEKSGKILISLSNSYAEMPVLEDGYPIAESRDHGFGTQSIRYTAEKLHGNCRFSLTDERFVLQVVL